MMSQLVHDLFVKSPLLAFPIFSLVVFILIFGAVLIRVFRRPATHWDDQAQLPLAEEEDRHVP